MALLLGPVNVYQWTASSVLVFPIHSPAEVFLACNASSTALCLAFLCASNASFGVLRRTACNSGQSSAPIRSGVLQYCYLPFLVDMLIQETKFTKRWLFRDLWPHL
ncbi:hypothetical protein FKP32DRAFT_30734 [Trametes sanguinea]|nr:hypothetical protein FKP32DRAFT_30734 [Trametes sanguinea]